MITDNEYSRAGISMHTNINAWNHFKQLDRDHKTKLYIVKGCFLVDEPKIVFFSIFIYLTLIQPGEGTFTLTDMSLDYLNASQTGLPGWIRVNLLEKLF